MFIAEGENMKVDNPETCAVLRRGIFCMVTSVAGVYAIADSLEDENIPHQ